MCSCEYNFNVKKEVERNLFAFELKRFKLIIILRWDLIFWNTFLKWDYNILLSFLAKNECVGYVTLFRIAEDLVFSKIYVLLLYEGRIVLVDIFKSRNSTFSVIITDLFIGIFWENNPSFSVLRGFRLFIELILLKYIVQINKNKQKMTVI